MVRAIYLRLLAGNSVGTVNHTTSQALSLESVRTFLEPRITPDLATKTINQAGP
jgi:hypothetical protein